MAGVILGVSYPLLDLLHQRYAGDGKQAAPLAPGGAPNTTSAPPAAPSWPTVMLCIGLFVAQYGLSGKLEEPLSGLSLGPTGLVDGAMASTAAPSVPALDAFLAAYALMHFLAFDRTLPGCFMSLLTAVGGPAIEIALINSFHLYHYEHPDLWGVPTWIPWVYFCGGPAVGLLGRRVWADLGAQEEQQAKA